MTLSYEAYEKRIADIAKIAEKRRVKLLVYIDERRMLSFCEIRDKCRLIQRVFMLGMISQKGEYSEQIN